jgi:hypothetical protein
VATDNHADSPRKTVIRKIAFPEMLGKQTLDFRSMLILAYGGSVAGLIVQPPLVTSDALPLDAIFSASATRPNESVGKPF